MTLEATHIRDVVQAVVGSCLNLDASWLEELPPGLLREQAEEITGCVTIHGTWNGVVMVSCSTRLAIWLASRMFETLDTETTAADADDALGEIANIIGGNLKSLLSGDGTPCRISLPMIARGPVRIVGGGTRRLVSFGLDHAVLQICVQSERDDTERRSEVLA